MFRSSELVTGFRSMNSLALFYDFMTSRCDSPIILCNVWNIDRIEYIQRRYVSSNFITSITVTFLVWLCLNSASAATHSQPHYFPDLVNIRIYSSSFHTHVLFLFFFFWGGWKTVTHSLLSLVRAVQKSIQPFPVLTQHAHGGCQTSSCQRCQRVASSVWQSI